MFSYSLDNGQSPSVLHYRISILAINDLLSLAKCLRYSDMTGVKIEIYDFAIGLSLSQTSSIYRAYHAKR